MKKIMVLVSMAFILFLASCETENKIKINFDVKGGNEIGSIYLPADEELDLPTPSKEGYVFLGWYIDNSYENIIDYNKQKENEINLYAKWGKKDLYDDVVINFDTSGGEKIDSIVTNYYEDLYLPYPAKKGSIFLGWFFDKELNKPLNYDELYLYSEVTLYANWKSMLYKISFKNDNDKLTPLYFEYGADISKLPVPYKPEDTFVCWCLDENYETEFTLSLMPDYDIVLYAKWYSDDYNVEIPADDPLTDEVYALGVYDGNTLGNLNNLGLATYCKDNKLHYYAVNSNIYSYDPASNKTKLIYSIEHGGRAIYLNINKDILYFINSYNGHLMKYDLLNEKSTKISENEHSYLLVTDSKIYTLTSKTIDNKNRNVVKIYRTNTNEFVREGLVNIKNMNVYGTIIYYYNFDTSNPSIYIKGDSGSGRTSLFYLEDFDILDVYEMVLYMYDFFDGDDYFALSLTTNNKKGLYLFNTKDKSKLDNVILGDIHSINYDEFYLYFILDESIYRYNLKADNVFNYFEVGTSKKNIQIINHWIYYSDDSNNLYRINPLTKEVEKLN